MAVVDPIHVFIDETGDRGTGPNSSPHFALAAVACRRSYLRSLRKTLVQLKHQLGIPTTTPLHSNKLWRKRSATPGARYYAAVDALASLPVRIFYVTADTSGVRGKGSTAGIAQGGARLYNYTAKVALERISWMARDSPPHHPAIVTVAHVAGQDPKYLENYVTKLQKSPNNQSSIAWQWLSTPVKVAGQQGSAGLQWADVAAYALNLALPGSPRNDVVPLERLAASGALVRRTNYDTHTFASYTNNLCVEQRWWQPVTALIPNPPRNGLY